MKKGKVKTVISFFNELKKKPYGKGAIFFGFYLIFFIVILLILNFGSNKDNESKNEKKGNGIDITYIYKYDYSFEYKVELNNSTYLYTGSKVNNTFNYTYNGKDYYNIDNKSYIKEEEKEIDNPIKFNKLFKESVVNELISTSYVDSVTKYNNGDKTYGLLLSSNTLNWLLDEKETDIDEVPNSVKVTMGVDKFIKEVNYNLDNYCKTNDLCTSLNITIKYDFSKLS